MGRITAVSDASSSEPRRPWSHLHARSTHDLEELFWGMLSPGEMARNHLKTVVKRIDPGETGKVGLRELVTFFHTRQGGGKGNAGKTAETGLRRCVRPQSLSSPD